MNVFDFRERLIRDYRDYVASFIAVREPRLKRFVDELFASGVFWPNPLILLNPTFQPGQTVRELADAGLLYPDCGNVFRKDKSQIPGSGNPLQLHQHQREAILHACEGRNFDLTTGTRSGESSAYIVPIVDRILRTGAGKGIRAIIIYLRDIIGETLSRATPPIDDSRQTDRDFLPAAVVSAKQDASARLDRLPIDWIDDGNARRRSYSLDPTAFRRLSPEDPAGCFPRRKFNLEAE